MYDRKDKLTHEELIKILRGKDRCSSTWSEDHPEFAKLRNLLEEQGFIHTSRNSWNGDYVQKPFTLNGHEFKKGEKFPCGSAMGISFEVSRKMQQQKQGVAK